MYIRSGSCNRCGRCCDLFCPHFSFVANEDIKAGSVIVSFGSNSCLMARCGLNTLAKKADLSLYGGSCATFPTDPWQTKDLCGYKWTEVDDETEVKEDDVVFPPKSTHKE